MEENLLHFHSLPGAWQRVFEFFNHQETNIQELIWRYNSLMHPPVDAHGNPIVQLSPEERQLAINSMNALAKEIMWSIGEYMHQYVPTGTEVPNRLLEGAELSQRITMRRSSIRRAPREWWAQLWTVFRINLELMQMGHDPLYNPRTQSREMERVLSQIDDEWMGIKMGWV